MRPWSQTSTHRSARPHSAGWRDTKIPPEKCANGPFPSSFLRSPSTTAKTSSARWAERVQLQTAPLAPQHILLLRVPPPQLRALTRKAFHPLVLPVMEARPDNIAGVVASEFQVSGLFMFDQLSGSVSDLWNFVLHRLRDSASIGSLQLASAQQLDDMCKNVEARAALLFGLLSFFCLFLCVCLFVGLFFCLLFFGHPCHVSRSHQVSMSWHLTTSHHGVMMSGANLSNRVHSAAQWTASAHSLPMSKPVITPVLKALRNGLLRRIYFTHAQTCVMTCVFKVLCYTYFTHSQTCDNVRGQGATAHALHIPNLWQRSCFGTGHTHVQACNDIRVQSAPQWLRYILHTCPKLWCNPCSKCYEMHCFRTYFTHVQSCGVTRVQKVLRSGLLRYILQTCPKLWCNPCSKCYYAMECFGTYFTHVQCCDVTRVQSATQWTVSVHTSHMSQAVMYVGLRPYIHHTCPKVWCNPCSKCYGMDCFGTYFTHVQSCDVTRVQSATQWTASVHSSHMSKAVM